MLFLLSYKNGIFLAFFLVYLGESERLTKNLMSRKLIAMFYKCSIVFYFLTFIIRLINLIYCINLIELFFGLMTL